MDHGITISPPFFEIGPKAYMWGQEIVALARAAETLGRRYGVQVILTPQAVDIAPVAAAVEDVLVFAQHMDAMPPGRGIGATLPEAVKAAGARGVLLNHVERRLARDELARTMARARDVGLATLVCADDERDAVEVAGLGPTAMIVEEPTLIGGGTRDDAGRGGNRGRQSSDLAGGPIDPRCSTGRASRVRLTSTTSSPPEPRERVQPVRSSPRTIPSRPWS